MEGTYDVMLGSQKMGSVIVAKEGLYWKFSCVCDLCGEVMYYLMLQVAGEKHRLGILSPDRGQFGLETKIAMKRLEQGSPSFCLLAKHEQPDRMYVPVRPEEPFAYLHRLEEAYLANQEQQIGIMLPLEN